MNELLESGVPALLLGAGAMPWLAWRIADPRERTVRALQLLAAVVGLAAALAVWARAQNARAFAWNFWFAVPVSGVWALLLVPLMRRPPHSPFAWRDPAREAEAAEAVAAIRAIVEEDPAGGGAAAPPAPADADDELAIEAVAPAAPLLPEPRAEAASALEPAAPTPPATP